MRIRTIKPEWLLSETLASLSGDARTLSVGLILMADDEGRGRAGLPTIVAEVWRYHATPELVQETYRRATVALRELSDVGFVVLYEVDGKPYFVLPGFDKHQVINKKTKSKIPAPCADSRSTTVVLPEDSRTEQGTGKGNREVEGEQGTRARAPEPEPEPPTSTLASLVWTEWRSAFGRVPDTGGAAKLDRLLAGELLTVTREEARTVERLQALGSLMPETDREAWLRRAIEAWKADPWAKREGYPWAPFVAKAGELAAKAKPNHAPDDFANIPSLEDRFGAERLAEIGWDK